MWVGFMNFSDKVGPALFLIPWITAGVDLDNFRVRDIPTNFKGAL